MSWPKLKGFGASGLAVAFALGAAAARADDGVPITIINDGTTDIIVTVYDMNSADHRIVVPGERINGFSSVPITVTPGRNGGGNVSWTATTVSIVDTGARRCGRGAQGALKQDAVVHVSANARCPALPTKAG
jgi:hypothetical protein